MVLPLKNTMTVVVSAKIPDELRKKAKTTRKDKQGCKNIPIDCKSIIDGLGKHVGNQCLSVLIYIYV